MPIDMRIDFGRSPEGVIRALDRELGPHRALPLSDCPQGVQERLQWGDLVLTFSDEQFIGWRRGDHARGIVCAGGNAG